MTTDDEGGRRRYPPWVRAVLLALQVVAVVVGVVVGTATYDAWSEPDPPPSTTTTPVAVPEPPVTETPPG